ncbi:MAG: hypothetical protein AAGA12_09305 [Pseudomonadota bacterium]
MWEWITSIFIAAQPVVVVPDFDLNGDVWQQEIAFGTAAEICVCGTGCPDAPDSGYTITALTDDKESSQTIHFAGEIMIDGAPVTLQPSTACVQKAAGEPIQLTLLTKAGYPASSGTPVIDIR